MTTSETIRILNDFSPLAEPNPCQLHHKQFNKLTADEKRRAAENILAGDDPATAIKDAKKFLALNSASSPSVNSKNQGSPSPLCSCGSEATDGEHCAACYAVYTGKGHINGRVA